MEFMGVDIDLTNADIKGEELILSSNNSKVKVIVVPTDEELMIARDTFEIIS